jgi:type IX secretion system PorP/SprF family membrane protein
MVKKFVVVVLMLVSGGFVESAFAQDPEFTQFYANPLYLNPAFAGTARCPRFILNYRNQWPGLEGQFITYNFSYDQHVDALSGGIGLIATRDVAGRGILTSSYYGGIYSYQLSVSRNFSLKFGAQASYIEKAVNWDKLTFGDMIDDRSGFIYNTNESRDVTKRSNVDFSAGVLGYSKKYFAGFAAHHLGEPDEGLVKSSPLPRKYTGHVGAVIPLASAEDASLSPNILFQKQGDFQQLNLGMYLVKGPIVGGVWYRNQDSFILLLGIQQQMFKFGYSYDVTVSKLTTKTAGSHEVSFSLTLDCKPKKKKFRTISCPSF